MNTNALRAMAKIMELESDEPDDIRGVRARAVHWAVDEIERLQTARAAGERELLERAIDRMGWPEIHAFQAEMRKGQSIYEDAGGYFMRGLRRLFGLPQIDEEVVTYQRAARAMVEQATTTAGKQL